MSDTLFRDVGSGVATFERIKVIFSTIIFVIIIGIMIWVAYKMYRDPDTQKTSGKVINVISCDKFQGQNNISYTCNMTVEYIVDGQSYEKNIQITSNKNYQKDDQIDVVYNPSNPSEAQIGFISPKKIAYALIISIPILIILYTLYVYYIFKSKEFATGMGVLDIAGGVLRR